MSANIHRLDGGILLRFILIIYILFWLSNITCFGSENESIKFNTDYKLKRVTPNTVSVYQITREGEKQEFIFKDFNADLLLLVYRHIEIEQIAINLTKKYHLDKTNCRRQLKIALNTFEDWEIIHRNQ